jgi:hypothetical protein
LQLGSFEKIPDENAEFICRDIPLRPHSPVTQHLVLVNDSENDVGVSDIDAE